MGVIVHKILAFSKELTGGNPAGVVLEPFGLSAVQMKKISRRLQVSETAFVISKGHGAYLVRFFSPTVEVDLCGHATIASFYLIGSSMHHIQDDMIVLRQQTNAGLLPVSLHFKQGSIDHVMMTQQTPVFEPLSLDIERIARTIGVDIDDVDRVYSSHRVSTGLFTLPICVRSFDVLRDIEPDFQLIKHFCNFIGVGSLHVFTFDTLDSSSIYHARNFAPVYGVLEDPVTGTANGAVASYLFHKGYVTQEQVICEQGDIIGRAGRVTVDLSLPRVQVGGHAVIAETIDIDI
ncbi:MAG: PhzF family phenazine biosynthesis protein [Candidatus Thermoplasmatota archaeon]|nr:PhzF family phenazine biosynthesis protein [Candidatus Thermoplasmatota archaeon]